MQKMSTVSRAGDIAARVRKCGCEAAIMLPMAGAVIGSAARQSTHPAAVPAGLAR